MCQSNSDGDIDVEDVPNLIDKGVTTYVIRTSNQHPHFVENAHSVYGLHPLFGIGNTLEVDNLRHHRLQSLGGLIGCQKVSRLDNKSIG